MGTNISRITNLGSLSSLNSDCFNNCINLTSVVFPETLTTFGKNVFLNCGSLELDVTDKLKNITSIGYGAFAECSSITGELNMPNLQGILYAYTFSNTGITKIISLGEITSIKSVGNAKSPFLGTPLTDVVLPNTLESVMPNLFANISTLKNVNIPPKITELPAQMFYNCSELTMDITDKLNNIQTIGMNVFSGCTKITGTVNMPLCEYIQGFSNSGITGIGDISSAKELGSFSGCTNLVYDIGLLPKSITTLGSFTNCSNVTGELELPNLETLAGGFGNSGITKIKNIGIVTSIPNFVFNSINIRFINFPETVVEIGNNNTNTQMIILCNSIVPPTLTVGNNVKKCYVPDDSVEAYKQASNWNNFADRIYPLSEYVDGEEDEITE